MDAWFTNEPCIANILAEGLDVIGMLKDNKQSYIYKGKKRWANCPFSGRI